MAPLAVESAADWGGLLPELLALMLERLSGGGGALPPRHAAQLLAAASPCRRWQALALAEVRWRWWRGCCGNRAGDGATASAAATTDRSTTLLPRPQLRISIACASTDELERLAASPGPPCTALALPTLPATCASSFQDWQAAQRLAVVAERLLSSAAFRRRSSATLRELTTCPLGPAASGALLAFPALHRLTLSTSLTTGNRDALRLSPLVVPPAVRRLAVSLPCGGAKLGHLPFPEHLTECTIDSAGGTELAPCSCVACAASSSFWATCQALHVTASLVSLDADACHALRSCTRLRLASQACIGSAAASAGPADVPRALSRWLAAVAPLFAATPLRTLQLRAALADASGGAWPILLAGGSLPPSGHQAARACLAAAALPPGFQERIEERGMAAELQRPPGSAELELCICRCT